MLGGFLPGGWDGRRQLNRPFLTAIALNNQQPGFILCESDWFAALGATELGVVW